MAKVKSAKKQGTAPIRGVHRFPLRISLPEHKKIDAMAFRHNISLNVLYTKAIAYAMQSEGFQREIEHEFPRDDSRGAFYI